MENNTLPMGDEVPMFAPIPDVGGDKPKQYLVLTDELHRALLAKLIPGIMFVEVEGLNMKDNDNYTLLVNPKPIPLTVTGDNIPPSPTCVDEA